MPRIGKKDLNSNHGQKIKRNHPIKWRVLEALIRQGKQGLTGEDGDSGNYGFKTRCLNTYVSQLHKNHSITIDRQTERKDHINAEPYTRYWIADASLQAAIKMANYQRIRRGEKAPFSEVVL